MLSEVKVGDKMLKMLYSTLMGRTTAKAPLVKEKKVKEGHQKFLVMKSFRRTYYTRVENTRKIRLFADIELIYHYLPFAV